MTPTHPERSSIFMSNFTHQKYDKAYEEFPSHL